MKVNIYSLFTLLSIPLAQAQFDLSVDSIYRFDNREFVSSESSEIIQKLSKSVAMIFNEDKLISDNGQFSIFANLLKDPSPIGPNVCADEKFAKHHIVQSACSGFLVAPDILVSAGHCFKTQASCDYKVIAFDQLAENEFEKGFKTSESNIFRCKEIMAQVYNQETKEDFSVIRLDRKTDRPVLKMRSSGKISNQDNVFMLGFPLGLPMMHSKEAIVQKNSDEGFFRTTLNSFKGNSGAPVFNAQTLEVEGILVRGEVDYVFDKELKCQRYAKYFPDLSGDEQKAEEVTRIEAVLPFIK